MLRTRRCDRCSEPFQYDEVFESDLELCEACASDAFLEEGGEEDAEDDEFDFDIEPEEEVIESLKRKT